MARYPQASWRPLGQQAEPRLVKKHKIILHTMVGSLDGTDNYFRRINGPGYSGTESHFGTDPSRIYQWQDTNWQADAQLQGNDDCISIETSDHGSGYSSWSGSNVPAWTSSHLEINAQLVAWLCQTHGIPCELIDNTRDTTRGIGYHRQGIDPYRDSGERYSGSFGKVCPGDRRVNQMPKLIARANEILNGDDMPITNDDADLIAERLLNTPIGPKDTDIEGWRVGHILHWGARMSQHGVQEGRDLWRRQAKILIEVAAIRAVMNAEPIDVAELARALAPLLVPPIVAELGDQTGATADEVAQQIRSVLGALDE